MNISAELNPYGTAFMKFLPKHGKGNWSKECECAYCLNMQDEIRQEIAAHINSKIAPKPATNVRNSKREDIPECNGMVDYKQIFSDETNKLIALYGNPETEITQDDNSKAMGMIEAIDSNMRQLEAALEELRIRKQARIKFRENAALKLDKSKREQLAKSDMDLRQKKQQEKLDKAANINKLKATQFKTAMKAIGWTDDQINTELKKRGMI